MQLAQDISSRMYVKKRRRKSAVNFFRQGYFVASTEGSDYGGLFVSDHFVSTGRTARSVFT